MRARTMRGTTRKLGQALARLGLLAGLLGSGTLAWGLDFSAEARTAQLGQPLHLRLTLKTATGEALRPECIQADIVDGERLLSGPDVAVRLEPAGQEGHWNALLMTNSPITQTLVKVTVSAGCEQRLWRRYTLKALPSAQQSAPGPQASEAAQAIPLLDFSGWANATIALLLLGAGLAWLARHPSARSGGTMVHRQDLAPAPTPPHLQRRVRAAEAPARQDHPPTTPPPEPPPQRQTSTPKPRAAHQVAAGPERQWPEIEQEANTLAAQGLLESAVELVMNYVRSVQRAHLMPYLKLLQLQRRRGDRAAFDDTRTLLEQHFKLHAPTWSGRRRALPALPEHEDASVGTKPTPSDTPARQSGVS